MKVFHVSNSAGAAVAESDIQIQTGAVKLGFYLTSGEVAPAVADWGKIEVRLKHVSSRGTQVLIERTSLLTLMEICSAREGCFIKSEGALVGTVDLTPNGHALDLAGGYLSLDVDTKAVKVLSLRVNAIDSPRTTNIFRYYNPVYVNGGITKEIDLLAVNEVSIDYRTIESLQLQFPERSISYLQEELTYIGRDLNDIVHVSGNGEGATACFGFANIITLPVPAVNRMTITPMGEAGFYLYLLEERAL